MNELAIKSESDLITFANNFIKKNNIIPSKNYNVENAMVSLYTNVLSVKDKQGKSALDVCTPISIQNAIYQCITQEFSPSKMQAYFIVYGNELKLQNSYFGNAKKAKDVAGVVINSQVVHDGDSIDAEMRANGTMIIRHKPNLTCLNKPIIMAYAVASNEITGEIVNSDIMTMEEIKKSWAKSKSGGAVSKEFPHEMARRTVTNRLAKHIINTSDDSSDVYITDIDGRRIKVNQYDDLPKEASFDYTINTEEQESFQNDDFIATENNTVNAVDLKLDAIEESAQTVIPEGAIEIDYNEVKGGKNKDKYKIIPNTFNKEKYTCYVEVIG